MDSHCPPKGGVTMSNLETISSGGWLDPMFTRAVSKLPSGPDFKEASRSRNRSQWFSSAPVTSNLLGMGLAAIQFQTQDLNGDASLAFIALHRQLRSAGPGGPVGIHPRTAGPDQSDAGLTNPRATSKARETSTR